MYVTCARCKHRSHVSTWGQLREVTVGIIVQCPRCRNVQEFKFG